MDEYDELPDESQEPAKKSAPDAVIFAGTLMMLGQGGLVGFILLYGATISPEGYAPIFIPIFMAIIGFGFLLIIMTIRGNAFCRWFMLCFQLMTVMTTYQSWGDIEHIGTFATTILGFVSVCWWISIMVMFYSSSVSEYYTETNPLASPLKSNNRTQIMQSAFSAQSDNDDDPTEGES